MGEKRLIDAYLFGIGVALYAAENAYLNDTALDVLKKVACWIDEAPTVDAEEVVRGEWEVIEDTYFDLVELKCSVCGESWGFEDYEDCIPQNYHYCPNCGAKMDGGVKNA